MSSIDTMALATAERTDFAEFLGQLSPAQWEAPTLCERWRVRDVVAHTISFDELNPVQLTGRFVRGLLSVNRINDLAVADYRDRCPQQLCDLVRTHARPAGLAKGFGGRIALTDNMIHQQDIRRPLGLPRRIPDERLREALNFARTAPLIRGAWRGRGVYLQATDLDWAAGFGPRVSGPGEALLMAMAGRAAALADLDGPGLPTFARRVDRGLV
jgi:uncharacterized protein (TIGR03083 family)